MSGVVAVLLCVFFLAIRHSRRSTLFPYTTLFRSFKNPKAPLATDLLLATQGWRRFAVMKDRKSTRLNSSHSSTSYAVFCLKKKPPTYEAADLNAHSRLELEPCEPQPDDTLHVPTR